MQAADALDYAHRQGVLHRDVKPSNLLLDLRGTVWVTDFGLAKADDSENLTETGDILGTLRYMPPEAFAGPADARGDVYALGLTLYELLALRPAFGERDRARLVKQVTDENPPRLSAIDPAIPRDLRTIVRKAVEKDPGHRYPSAAALADDLRRFAADQPIRARSVSGAERAWRWCRRNPAVAALLAAVVLVTACGFAGVAWKWREADAARRDAQAAEERLREDVAATNAAYEALEVGRRLADGSRWAEAEARMTEAIRRKPDLTAVWQGRAVLYGRLGLWDLAAADARRSLEAGSPELNDNWYIAALLALATGDKGGYRTVCARLRERDWTPSLVTHQSVAVRTCNLGAEPPPAAELRLLLEAKDLGTGHTYNWVHFYLQGTSHLRAGRHAEAIRLLEATLAATRHASRVMAHPVLAMAYHHAGRPAEARGQLVAAKAAIDSWVNTVLKNRTFSTPNQYWYDWVELLIYHREAAELMDGRPPPDDARFRAARGASLAHLGRHDAAAAEYTTAVRLAPDDAAIGFEVFRHAVEQGFQTTADAEFARLRALPRRADTKPFYLDAYRLYATHGRPDRAAAVLAEAVGQWPGDLTVRVEPVRFRAENEDETGMREAAAEIGRHKPDDADYRLSCADAYADMGLWPLAKDELRRALDLAPDKSEAWPKYGVTLLQVGDRNGYRTWCRELCGRYAATARGAAATHLAYTCMLTPDALADPAVLVPVADRGDWSTRPAQQRGLRGIALFRAGRFEEAAKDLGDAIRDGHFGDGVVNTRYVLAMVQHRLGRNASAGRWLAAGDTELQSYRLSFSPASFPRPAGPPWQAAIASQLLAREAAATVTPPARLAAQEAMKNKQWDRAIATLDGVLGPDRGEPDDWQLRAECHAAREDWAKARADYREAVRRGSTAVAQVWYPYAVLCLKAGDVAEYRATCRRLLEQFPDPGDRADFVAVICKLEPGAGVDLAALMRFEDRWSHNPGLTGQLLYRLGRFADAERALRPVAEASRNAWNDFVLAMCYARLDRPAEARTMFQAAVARLEATGPGLAWVYRLDLELLRAEAAAVVGVQP